MFGHDKFSTKITTYFVKDLIALYNSRNYLIAYAIHSVELITVTRPRPTTTRILVTATRPLATRGRTATTRGRATR